MRPPTLSFTPTPQQEAIDRAIALTSDNIQVQALAGTGKTTAMVWLVSRILERQPAARVYCLAFNRSTSDELRARMPRTVKTPTFHGLGLSICKRRWGSDIDHDSLRNLIDNAAADYLVDDPVVQEEIREDIHNGVSLCMATLTDPGDYEAVHDMMASYDRALTHPDASLLLIRRVIEMSRANTRNVCFDQMIDLVLHHQCMLPAADFVFVDEAQDMNAAQHEMVARMVQAGARLVAVGDPHQAIYRFRGADSDSMEVLRIRFAMQVLPLSVTFRCGKEIVNLARQIVPAYEAAPSNADGLVEMREPEEYDQTLGELKPGDMVLCRTNAPLVAPVLRLISEGRRAYIHGRDIGASLARLVRRFAKKSPDLKHMLRGLGTWLVDEASALQKKRKITQANALLDKKDTIFALAANVRSVAELLDLIKDLFVQPNDGTGKGGRGRAPREHSVMFCTVHKAKGLESKRVVIIRPDLMPPPWVEKADSPEQALKEEDNIRYVAITRAMDTLIIQHGND